MSMSYKLFQRNIHMGKTINYYVKFCQFEFFLPNVMHNVIGLL